MVFLTSQLWLRNRLTDRYWRIQEVLRHARVSRPGPRRGPPAPPAPPRGPSQPPACLPAALPGTQEPLLPAGGQGRDPRVREMH